MSLNLHLETDVVRIIEQNLFAIAKTSERHYENLQEHVHNPTFLTLTYKCNNLIFEYKHESSSLQTLRELYKKVKTQCRPDVRNPVDNASLRSTQKEGSQLIVPRIDNSSFEIVRTLFSKASAIHRNVGSWAADWFITQAIRYQDEVVDLVSADPFSTFATGNLGKNLLLEVKQSAAMEEPELSVENISAKAIRLVKYLESDLQSDSKVLIFAEQRVVVVALANLLSNYPGLKSKLSVGTFIGLSSCNNARNGLKDASKVADQMQVLDDFKKGTKNLIVATSVLEEGIDVSSCEIVICFDPPKNPVSFIQRRGRARQPKSSFILLLSEDEPNVRKIEEWRALELRTCETSIEHERGPRDQAQQDCRQDENRLVIKKTGCVLSN